MPLNSNTKFLMRFDDDTLIEEVSGALFNVGGSGSVVVDDGYQMQEGQYLYKSNYAFGITTAFTLSFWFKPTKAGVAINTSNVLQDMYMPLILVGTGIASGSNYELSVERIRVRQVIEEDYRVKVNIRLTANYTIESSVSLDPDVWHHVVLRYRGSPSLVELYIDGAQDSTPTTSGPVPANVSASTAAVWINKPSGSSGYDVLYNRGQIKDICFRNTVSSSDFAADVKKIINSGIDFIVDSSYANLAEAEYALLFDDPAAVKLTDFYSDGTSMFVARTDGKLLQGAPLLWEVRKNFANLAEDNVLKKFGSGVEVTDGNLSITNGTVRL